MKSLAVVDTNVVVSALPSHDGVDILNLMRLGVSAESVTERLDSRKRVD